MVKNEVIKYLENNKGKLVSGGELSKKLNVSRTAIWKAINILKNDGYDIESFSNEGYRLNIENNVLSENMIKANLKTKILGSKFEILKTIDSTNNYAKIKASKGEKEGLVIISEEQTNGRGRINKSFFSPFKSGIYMTVLIRPDININNINIVTVATAISVLKAIELKANIKPSIKWVNDILYGKKKLCGILTEASIEGEGGHVEYIVIGIGINISICALNFSNDIKDIAISIEEITGKHCDRNELICEVLNQLEYNYIDLITNNNKKRIIDIYKDNLSMIGEKISVIQGNNSYYAKILGINDNAELIVEDEVGKVIIVNSGEISIKRAN